MKLQRKPRVGDRIGFGRFNGPGNGSIASVEEPLVATGIVKRVDGNLCYWLHDDQLDEPRYHTCFIWWFYDGLNRLARIFNRDGTMLCQSAEEPSGVLISDA